MSSALDRLPLLTQWVLLALAVGLLGAWVRRLQVQAIPPAQNASYAEAYELISQLRVVARQLSSGLDTVTLATVLLEDGRHVPRGASRRASRTVPRLTPSEPASSTSPRWSPGR